MKVAVTSQGQTLDSMVDPRFGRAKYFILVDTETGEFESVDNNQNFNAAQGAGIQSGQNVANLGVAGVITGNVGPKAFMTLNAAAIKVFLCPEQMTVQAAMDQLKAGKLQSVEQANVQGHWI
ncbi:MAG: NifB/NifX family molybdenum-iron cluster-binding protein [Sedimentisphaerales bacterium]|nr:NifB/NifX family molybdenum-iron cluster-binding protein [Sedimentisphaerales bacterium]